jgi:RNA polymerase sigma factor (sigma-70 family)
MMMSTEVAALVGRAKAGDGEAWEKLVAEYTDLLWGVARRFRLTEAQRADAVQNTWLRLIEHLGDIREPERLAGWLATTTRRACIEVAGQGKRENPSDFLTEQLDAAQARLGPVEGSCPERSAMRREHVEIVRRALAELPAQHRQLLDLLVASAKPCYQDVVEQLGMPHGSIGPTRARILARLRVTLEASGLHDMALT